MQYPPVFAPVPVPGTGRAQLDSAHLGSGQHFPNVRRIPPPVDGALSCGRGKGLFRWDGRVTLTEDPKAVVHSKGPGQTRRILLLPIGSRLSWASCRLSDARSRPRGPKTVSPRKKRPAAPGPPEGPSWAMAEDRWAGRASDNLGDAMGLGGGGSRGGERGGRGRGRSMVRRADAAEAGGGESLLGAYCAGVLYA
jgi:hypothetical protein